MFPSRGDRRAARQSRLDDDRVDVSGFHLRKRGLELGRRAHHEDLNGRPGLTGVEMDLLEEWLGECVVRVCERSDALRGRHDFANELKAFPGQLRRGGGQSGDVSTGAGEAGDKPGADRVAGGRHDNWNVGGGSLCRQRGRCFRRDQNIDLERNQFSRERGKPVQFAFGATELDLNILAVDVAKVAHAGKKVRHEWFAVADEQDAEGWSASLRVCCEWSRKRSAERGNKSPPGRHVPCPRTRTARSAR